MGGPIGDVTIYDFYGKLVPRKTAKYYRDMFRLLLPFYADCINVRLKNIMIRRSLILVCIPFLAIASDPLPSSYHGIVLLQSTLEEVKSKFGAADLFEIPYGHHQYGYCYKAESGVAVIFSSSSEGDNGIIREIQIRNITAGFTCAETDYDLRPCIGQFCLGISQPEIEAIIGKPLTETTTGSGSKVAGFQFNRKLSQEEQKVLNPAPGSINANIYNNIWANFNESGAFALGIVKFKVY